MGDAGANVIFIHWHDLGRHLPCYGAQGVVSPALDRLAAQGILFTDAHATAPLCSPARGSLFTGQYPHRNGLIGLAHHGFAYHPGVQTLPSLLADGGYRTVLIGMQHESTDPTTLGFDTVDVSESRCDYVTDEAIGWLEREGVITGYTVKVDPGRVGRPVDALVDIRLLPSTDPDQFERLVHREIEHFGDRFAAFASTLRILQVGATLRLGRICLQH